MKNRKKLILIMLTFTLLLLGCEANSDTKTQNTAKPDKNTDKTTVETKTEIDKKTEEKNNYLSLLQGRWMDTTDNKSEILFKNSLKTDYYEKKEVDSSEFTLEKSCEGVEPAKTEQFIVQDENCWYITDLTEENLQLSYVGRGNSLFYIRVADTKPEIKTSDEF